MTQNVQPIFIMPEDTKRTTGKDAQRNNILAAKAVAQTVRTTLGPKGMDKMIVDSMSDVTVTNDGVTILNEMQIEHPAAKMVVEVAKAQEEAIGDGTTTAVILSGELLKKAEDLLDQEIHPTIIARGYRLAEEHAQKLLTGMADMVTLEDEETLKKVAITAMTGKGAETAKEHLASLAVKAVRSIAERHDTGNIVERDNVKVEKRVGAPADKSELIQGILIDKEKVHDAMSSKVENAKIALLDFSLEIKNTEIDAKIQITDPNQLQAFLDQEEKTLRDMVQKIRMAGVTVVFCQKGIDDLVQHFLAKENILAARRVKKSDMEKLAKATNGKVVSNLNDLTSEDLGNAGLVRAEKIGDEDMIFVEQCVNPKAVTLLVRGGTDHVVEEIKRAVEDALGDVVATVRDGKIVAGAGATEIELAKGLRQYASSLRGREQLAVQAFADAVEVVPRTLAENAGLDPIDVLTKLRSANEQHKWSGIDVFTGDVMNAMEKGVIEPLKIKTQAISSAAEVAEMILRIDDVVLSSKNNGPAMPPGGMPPMGGMM
ncbi:MAG: thermosome subunit [Nanoarchaeota archaeon]|nr:thermosome subunit [Nanoarchaeota archaeon]